MLTLLKSEAHLSLNVQVNGVHHEVHVGLNMMHITRARSTCLAKSTSIGHLTRFPHFPLFYYYFLFLDTRETATKSEPRYTPGFEPECRCHDRVVACWTNSATHHNYLCIATHICTIAGSCIQAPPLIYDHIQAPPSIHTQAPPPILRSRSSARS
jgi:hypothetical protein